MYFAWHFLHQVANVVCYGRRAIVSSPNMESPGGMGDSDSPVLTPAIVIHAGVSF